MKTLFALALLLVVPGAWGQAVSVMGPNADRVRTLAASIKERPSDWVIIVEDELTWQRIRLQWHSPSVTAFTERHAKVTYVREQYAFSATTEKLRHSLAHEVGHLLTGPDEYGAEKWATDHGY